MGFFGYDLHARLRQRDVVQRERHLHGDRPLALQHQAGRLTHAALRQMVPRGAGGILNVASVGGFQPAPGNATYSATKAFVLSFTEAVHDEVVRDGVRVTCLCPGFTRTAFQDRAGLEAAAVPGFLWSDPASVARAGLKALQRNKAVCIPGLVNKGAPGLVRLLPRAAVRRIAGVAVKRMER